MTETSPLLERRSSVRFNNVNTNQEANLEHAAHDLYEALVDDVDDSELDEDALWLREQRDLNKSLHWVKRPSLIMVGIASFLFAFATGTAEASRKIILFKLACQSIINDGRYDYCDPSQVEMLISNLQLFSTFSSSFLAILVMTKIGELSDIYGRKRFIIIIFINFLIARSIKYYLMSNFNYLKFTMIVLSDVIASASGGLMAYLSLLNCYVSDIAEVHQRSYYIGVSMAFVFSGISMGPLAGNFILSISKKFTRTKAAKFSIGGFSIGLDAENKMIQHYEYNPLRFELLILLILVLFVGFILPESRSQKARRKSRTMSANFTTEDIEQLNHTIAPTIINKFKRGIIMIQQNITTLLKPVKLLYIPMEFKPSHYSHEKFQRERLSLILMTLVDCFLTGVSVGSAEIIILYGILKYNWGSTVLGYYLAFACAGRAIVLVGLAPILNHHIYHKLFGFKLMKRHFDMLDYSNVFLGLIAEVIATLGFAIAPSTPIFFMFLGIASLSSLISPSLNSAIVKYYPDSKTGELFGAISFVKNLFNLTVPVIFLTIYKFSLSINFPELMFVILSGLMVVCSGMIITVKYLLDLNGKSVPEVLTRTSSSSSLTNIAPNLNAVNQGNVRVLERNPSINSEDPLTIGELHRKNSNISQHRRNSNISQYRKPLVG